MSIETSMPLTRRGAAKLIGSIAALPLGPSLSRADQALDRDVMVPMREGGGLATAIYRPCGEGRYPVILERTPYDKTAVSRSERTAAVAAPRSRAEVASYFVREGYVVVYQDC